MYNNYIFYYPMAYDLGYLRYLSTLWDTLHPNEGVGVQNGVGATS